jgi:hypothetical protein
VISSFLVKFLTNVIFKEKFHMASTTAVAQIMAKVARNCTQLGLTVLSNSGAAVVIDNGSNDLTVSYVAASIDLPMGGVSPASSPFLGIGVVAPGQLKLKSSSTAADTIADVLDSVTAAKVLQVLAGFCNDIVLENSDATFTATLRGNPDLLGMGQ